MSKMSDWVLELELDKIDLTREQFVEKYGTRFAYIYDEQLGAVPKKRKAVEEDACMC
jgi:hypothetical protein